MRAVTNASKMPRRRLVVAALFHHLHKFGRQRIGFVGRARQHARQREASALVANALDDCRNAVDRQSGYLAGEARFLEAANKFCRWNRWQEDHDHARF